jgi:hypothetical protein
LLKTIPLSISKKYKIQIKLAFFLLIKNNLRR